MQVAARVSRMSATLSRTMAPEMSAYLVAKVPPSWEKMQAVIFPGDRVACQLDPSPAKCDGIPAIESLRKLGERHGFTVTS